MQRLGQSGAACSGESRAGDDERGRAEIARSRDAEYLSVLSSLPESPIYPFADLRSSMARTLTIKSTQKLLSGSEMPVLGYGVYKTPASVAEEVTVEALRVGYRHIDSAAAYGNENQVAAAIKSAGLARSDVFLTTKIPPAASASGYEAARQSINDSLRQAATEYFDLILIHAPFGGKEARLGSWRALVEAQRAGKTRSIGVSNFGIHHLKELDAYIQSGGGGQIEVGQYEIHPWLGRSEVVEWLWKRGAVVQAYCPIVRNQRGDEPILQELSRKYGKTPAQVLIRWSLQKGFVPLPKSVTPSRIKENADVFDFELGEDDMARLTTDKYEPCAWDPTVSPL
ncbi:aldo/keto reductase [Aspergillus lucknowensis]|uniref:D-xylose reductase [NAD(P)H] n=1 Tax=Aspergillus lucknowensis TaxID=176173 RepID=A0ABR4LPB7_9EURO